MSIVVAILVFTVIVLIHELGHFIAARKCGILVEEFAIGMGPRLFSIKRGDTVYSLRLFPIGGFCAMLGENNGDQDPRAFNSKTVGQRFLVLSAGVLMNFLLAFVIFTAMAFFSVISEPMVNRVAPDSPAMSAGLEVGDRIIRLDKDTINIYEDLMFALSKCDGGAVDAVILRDGQKLNKVITPRMDEYGDYKIGFELVSKTGVFMESVPGFERAGVLETGRNGFYRIVFYIRITVYGVMNLITMNVNLDDISGPVGIVDTIGRSYTASAAEGAGTVIRMLLMFIAILSANLGVMNFLPLPALDGGRMIFILLEVIRRKPLPPEKEGMVHFAGFVLLMLLSVVIAYNDVAKLLFK